MKRLLILSVFLIGGLVQMPTSASSHDTSDCYELWEEASRDGIDAIDKIQLVDMGCSKFLSPDNTRWVDSKPQQPSSSSSYVLPSSSSDEKIWCATAETVKFTTRVNCEGYLGGKVFSTPTSAAAEHRRLKSGSSTSYASSRCTDPICGYWELNQSGMKWIVAVKHSRLSNWNFEAVITDPAGLARKCHKRFRTTVGDVQSRFNKVSTNHYGGQTFWRSCKDGRSLGWRNASVVFHGGNNIAVDMNVGGKTSTIFGRRTNQSSTVVSSSGSGKVLSIWCANSDDWFRASASICSSKGGQIFAGPRQAKNAYLRLKPSSSTSYASSSSDNPESWCVRSSGVTKERFQRCVNSGGLQSYRGKADALAAYDRLMSGSSTSYASSSQSTTTASLTIRSNVREDRVYIDGKYKGSTRLDLDLPKGRHTIRIKKEGYKTYEEAIDLKNTLTLRASLEKIAEKPVQTASTDNSSIEVTFWKSIQGSKDAAEYRAYLESFPKGKFAPLAKLKIKKLGGASVAKSSIPNLDYGRYHALVIGNNNYRHMGNLRTAVNDARRVASVLETDYGFDVQLIRNAGRSEIIKSLAGLRRKVRSQDNLLIYYAGHGYLDEAANEGYWLPIDAEREDPSNWIPNDTIVAQVRAMDAKHVMVVADSCFSGTITRGLKIEQRTPGWLQKIVKKKSRTALTSGGLEPVMDSGGGNHSAFASAFISLLEENEGVLDASQLFSQLRPKVMVNSTQTPEYGNIHQAGHDGGDFLFVRQ